MNTKKNKHKKPNKPPNPSPPQKLEVTKEDAQEKSKEVENIVDIETKCEIPVQSEVKGEVISEISETEKVEETPQKPKRNKGKKKQQDVVDKEVEVPREVSAVIPDPIQEVMTESIEKDILDETVLPSARKKKNKKKNQNIAEQKAPEIHKPLSTELIEPVAEVTENVDPEIQELFSPNSEMPKDKKKKNKKKKRNDSEKSEDKEEISCTTAFQQLLQETVKEDISKDVISIEAIKETPVQENIDVALFKSTEESNENIVVQSHEQQDIKKESKKKNKKDKKQPVEETLISLETEQKEVNVEPLEISKEETKGKKKNKKDKKQHIDEPTMPVETVEKLMETLPEIKPILEPIEKILEAIEKEPSPKPKAKIAKPVEKKRKEKQEDLIEIVESPEIKNEASQKEYKKEVENMGQPDMKLEKVFPDTMELKVETSPESKLNEEVASADPKLELIQEVEHISVPDNKMEKKKKSPKPKRKGMIDMKNISEFSEIPSAQAIREPIETLKNISESVKPDEQDIDTKTKDLLLNPPDIFKDVKSELEPNIKEIKEEANVQEQKKNFNKELEKKMDDEGFETKTGKKKKKLPKTPKQEESAKLEPLPDKKVGDNQEKVVRENPEVLLDTSFTEIEVRSVKTDESESSTCDVTPDITFIRATSEVFDNNNNNTVIQEVVSEELKFNDPTVPIIEGSGETPINTPELVKSELGMPELIKTDIELLELFKSDDKSPDLVKSDPKSPELPELSAKSREEKTDLKSKMLEVNQDMEELRLSIERSLAEFTALDKEEKTGQKQIKQNLNVAEPPQVESTKEVKMQVEGIKDLEKDKAISLIPEPPICPTRKDNKGKNKKKGKESTQSAQSTSQSTTQSTAQSSTSKDTTHTQESAKEEKDKPVKKSESKEKGKQKAADVTNDDTKDSSDEKTKSKHKSKSQEKGKQKTDETPEGDRNKKSKQELNSGETDKESTSDNIQDTIDNADNMETTSFEPIESFEDALTSSIEDVNKSFELIAEEADNEDKESQKKLSENKPEINITEEKNDQETDDKEKKSDEKTHPASQPKNFLGHYNIPVQSNKTDYKKERNKTPNTKQAKVKIKDSENIEQKHSTENKNNSTENLPKTRKNSTESQTELKRIKKHDRSVKETFSKMQTENDEFIYKYSFRKVFLPSVCQICFKHLGQVRVPCGYCHLVFYCGVRHKDEDWPQHQALCFAVSTLAHMKDQKHIYADAQNITGQEYRLLRMNMIISCEKVLKRRLVPWEQEAMLYPRVCADVGCREWRQGKLKDCDGCAQLSYCSNQPEHLPKTHQRWCKSYSLYEKLVTYQQTKGRLEPKLPTKVMIGEYEIPSKINEVLAAMYEEKIDMNDIQYAALTQIATAPLTTAYCLQLCKNKAPSTSNGVCKNKTFTIHVVGAELQFEADALNKWEVFFLHLVPEVQELKVVLISKMLNPGNLPLDLLAKIKLCEYCRQSKRRVVFIFEDNKHYFEYRTSEDFIHPDIICAFNPSIQRSSIYNGNDPWPASINNIIRLKTPFIVTSYTLNELRKDIAKIKQCSDNFKLVLEPGFNHFASVRPDRNFISDDEMPLLFKNYCVAVVLGC